MHTGEQNGILDAVGNTPLLSLNRISARVDALVYAKVERFNPGGSIKDRAANSMLLAKIRSGEIDPAHTTIVESSSGNLAIGLAQLCRYFDMPFICVVDPKTPAQSQAILHSYGVTIEVVQHPDPASGEFLPARLRRIRELLAEVPGAYWPDQYSNPLNPSAHEITMGEIARDLDGRVDYLFAAVSTTGTLRGCSDYIRANGLSTTVVAVDAVGSVLFCDAPPSYRLIPGYGASVRPPLLDASRADQVVHVTDLECVVGCRWLMRYEAMLMGGSAGATVAALHKMAESVPRDATCVLLFPDGGDRYLETIYSDPWVRSQFGEVAHLWKADA
ncbi:MAG TPA: 2,3-diaminopropionate biosynthesis protein SbnA [Asanoa sp.]|nr:2,3-diaminopropionate biosynthesis protein SbnA [Asanoa sp.]